MRQDTTSAKVPPCLTLCVRLARSPLFHPAGPCCVFLFFLSSHARAHPQPRHRGTSAHCATPASSQSPCLVHPEASLKPAAHCQLSIRACPASLVRVRSAGLQVPSRQCGEGRLRPSGDGGAGRVCSERGAGGEGGCVQEKAGRRHARCAVCCVLVPAAIAEPNCCQFREMTSRVFTLQRSCPVFTKCGVVLLWVNAAPPLPVRI